MKRKGWWDVATVFSKTVCVCVCLCEHAQERERETEEEESESYGCIDEPSCKIHGQGKIRHRCRGTGGEKGWESCGVGRQGDEEEWMEDNVGGKSGGGESEGWCAEGVEKIKLKV